MITIQPKNYTKALRPRIAFVSSCDGNWGGSEDLWAGTALWLARAGHGIHVFKTNVDEKQPRIIELRAVGCRINELDEAPPLFNRLTNRMLPFKWQQTREKRGVQLLRKQLHSFMPHLVVISQGANYDGIAFADICRQLEIPYVLVSQKATNSRAPYASERLQAQEVYQKARRSYFVSQHNLELTQLQLGMRLPSAEVIRNPYNVAFNGEQPWPADTDEKMRLACVARLYLSDKGQDILLQTLAQHKWRQRPLTLTLYGAGPDEDALRGMVSFLRLQEQVAFGGHVAHIEEIWRTHHALILPSRYEGLPLALVEAMLSGRPTIAADAGGISELLIEGVTGFLANGLTVNMLDEALENAWAARSKWPMIGAEAARQARSIIPNNALAAFANKLLDIINETQPK